MKFIHRSSIALLLTATLATLMYAQTTPPSANEVLKAAVVTAKAQQKNVLIHFGASWCTWCKHLDKMLESAEVGQLFRDNYVITHLTIQERNEKVGLENPGAQALVDSAGGKDSGVPVYIFFDSVGNRLATSMAMPNGGNIGHPVTPEEIQAFEGLLVKTAPRMTAAERKQIVDYLSKQKY
jgi:thiol:disulfide interchange protein